MRDTKNLFLSRSATLRQAAEVIDRGQMQIALVVEGGKLIGTITDGDLRRSYLRGCSLDFPIESVYNKNPIKAYVNQSKESIIQLARSHQVRQIPITDSNDQVVGLEFLDDFFENQSKKNSAIIMAGGKGQRLKPLTDNTPKPMLTVGQKPILQTIIENLAKYGVTNIFITLNYRGDIIKNYFGNGSKFGVSISYIYETKPMGTAGSLSLFYQKAVEPFFVINGDILTNINYSHLLNFHRDGKAYATMCVKKVNFEIPYGVVDIENATIKALVEKPMKSFFVNAGIYVLGPECLEHIPQNTSFDMPCLFESLLRKNEKVLSFPVREYWMDVGRSYDLDKANQDSMKQLYVS